MSGARGPPRAFDDFLRQPLWQFSPPSLKIMVSLADILIVWTWVGVYCGELCEIGALFPGSTTTVVFPSASESG
jgi:hypothetical protein